MSREDARICSCAATVLKSNITAVVFDITTYITTVSHLHICSCAASLLKANLTTFFDITT